VQRCTGTPFCAASLHSLQKYDRKRVGTVPRKQAFDTARKWFRDERDAAVSGYGLVFFLFF
jgi:hypothetical protein